jgi:hypothetical protein
MSYFDPVLTEEQLRLLPKVMEVLKTSKQRGWKYKDNDLWWHHIQKHFGEVELKDLGSLEKCDKDKINIDNQKE